MPSIFALSCGNGSGECSLLGSPPKADSNEGLTKDGCLGQLCSVSVSDLLLSALIPAETGDVSGSLRCYQHYYQHWYQQRQ